MSLDIWGKYPFVINCDKCGHRHEIEVDSDYLFDMNITNNLARMAKHAGCGILWEDIDGKAASSLKYPLKKAISELESKPHHYDRFNASNGWGTRDQFLPWLRELLQYCENHPNAKVYNSY